jgi:AraC-like DNA-binding protein
VRELPLHDCRPRHGLQLDFWQTVEAVTADPYAGLHLCRYMPPYRGRGLEYVLLASGTLRAGLKNLLVYRRLISDAFDAEVIEDDEGARIRLRGTTYDGPEQRHPEICYVWMFVTALRIATDDAVQPTYINLCIPSPARPQTHESVFGCRVGFDTHDSEIWLASDALDTPLVHSDAELLVVHCQHADRRLADVARYDKLDELYQSLLAQFENGQRVGEQSHTFARVAYDLGLSERRLRFELGEIDANFRDLFRHARLTHAKRLLEGSVDRVDDIAQRLGFSDPSGFSRAFRRYFGLTPSAYRDDQSKKSDQ